MIAIRRNSLLKFVEISGGNSTQDAKLRERNLIYGSLKFFWNIRGELMRPALFCTFHNRRERSALLNKRNVVAVIHLPFRKHSLAVSLKQRIVRLLRCIARDLHVNTRSAIHVQTSFTNNILNDPVYKSYAKLAV